VAYEFFIARRYLRSKQRTGLISLIAYMAAGGVILGVAALLIMLSVTNGFSGEVKNRLIGMNAHVMVQRFYSGPMEEYQGLLQKITTTPGVVAAAPVVDSKVVIAAKQNTQGMDGVFVWGVEPESFQRASDLPRYLTYSPDRTLRLGTAPGQAQPGIVLGERLARRLRVGLGDEVLLMTVKGMDLNDVLGGFAPKLWPFLVTDTFESGMYHYDDNFAFISLTDAQRVFGLGEGVSNIHVRVGDLDQATQMRQTLETELGYEYQVLDWTQLFPELFRWMELEKWVIFIALSLIILVAAFNIMSILIMSILVKTPEIGILRAMGVPAAGIRRIFVYQGLVIGVAGTFLGALLGFALCHLQQRFELISIPGDIYIISSLPVDMQVLDFALVGIVSLAICLLAAVYPARKAAALLPVDAIKYIM
jgi:lipoprotein-releasing system permease protein